MNTQVTSSEPLAEAVLLLLTNRYWQHLMRKLPVAWARAICVLLMQVRASVGVGRQNLDAIRNRTLSNARLLGVAPEASHAREFLRRHERFENLRQAEDLLVTLVDVAAFKRWVDSTCSFRGLEHANLLAAQNCPAIVVGAHHGAMPYYTYFLASHVQRERPRICAVMNAASVDVARRVAQRLSDLEKIAGVRATLLQKQPGEERQLLSGLRRELRDGSWAFMQIDVISGGAANGTVRLGPLSVRMPGIFGAVRLARLHEVPLLPVGCQRKANGKIIIKVERPLMPIHREDEAAVAQQLADCLWEWLKECPEDWTLLPRLHHLVATERSS